MHRQRPVRPRALAMMVLLSAGVLGAMPAVAHASIGWTPIASFPPPPLRDHAAATGPDGRVYIIGGRGDTGVWGGVAAYTPSSNTWTQVASLSAGRDQLAAATSPAGGNANGRIYAMGGNDSNNNALSLVEQYTPSSNTWTTVSPLPTPRKQLAAATGSDGRIYAIGGCCNPGATTTVQVYTPSTNQWATVAPLNHARSGSGATAGLDGRIYVLGGGACCPNSTPTNGAEVYDPSANTWTDIAPMSTARQNVAAATGADGRIFAIGGGDAQGNPLASVEAYDPATHQWSPAPTMGTTRSDLAATTSPEPGSGSPARVYALGGVVSTNGTFDSSAEALDTSASSPPIPEAPSTVLIAAAGLLAIGAAAIGVRRRARAGPAGSTAG